MITVTISKDGQFADEIQFDDANVVAYEGTVTVIHRSVMQESDGGGLWQRVAHAAGIVAERGNLPDALEAEHRLIVSPAFVLEHAAAEGAGGWTYAQLRRNVRRLIDNG